MLKDLQRVPVWVALRPTSLFSFAMAAICLHVVDVPIKIWREKAWAPGATAPSLRAET
jgi:hypothetical protein